MNIISAEKEIKSESTAQLRNAFDWIHKSKSNLRKIQMKLTDSKIICTLMKIHLLFSRISEDETNYYYSKENDRMHLDSYSTLERSKRSYSHDRYIELMIVADSEMARYHGDSLKPYILTLMSSVSIH